MRRIVASFGGATLLASLLALPVAAAPGQHTSGVETVLVCDGLTTEDGTLLLFAVESEEFGTFGDLAFWDDEPVTEFVPPTWIAAMAEVEFDGDTVTGTFLVVENDPATGPDEPPFGDEVGTAVLSATLTEAGEPERYSFKDKQGNTLFRRQGVAQPYAVEGMLELPGGIVYDLSACDAFLDTFDQFSNAPASQIFRSTQFGIDCFWQEGGQFITLFAANDEFGAFSHVSIFDEETETDIVGRPTSEPILTTTQFEWSWELFDFDDPGGDPVGTAEASATLTEGEKFTDKFDFGPGFVQFHGTRYSVEGELSISTDARTTVLPMNDETCFAAEQRVTEHITPGAGSGGGGGRPLANDAPEAALPLSIGETTSVGTAGADLEPELPCIGEFEGETFEIPIGRTGWWTFEGTGDLVTVDTAGSDFDTVVGLYVDDGTGLVPIGCVDDPEDGNIAARLTLPSEAGATYYVQAGGIFGESGTLVLSLY